MKSQPTSPATESPPRETRIARSGCCSLRLCTSATRPTGSARVGGFRVEDREGWVVGGWSVWEQ